MEWLVEFPTMKKRPVLLLVAGLTALAAVYAVEMKTATNNQPVVSGQSIAPNVQNMRAMIKKLEPLHKKLGKPRAGDWLAHFDEPGQTFEEWLKSDPRMATGTRNIIYVRPLGGFSDEQKKIVEKTADFMGLYFNLKTKMLENMPADKIPDSGRRNNPLLGYKQVLTGYVLEKVLKPALPEDAAVLIAFTSEDLTPGAGWNFVFGQASLEDRIGVWSLYRMSETSDEEGYRLALLRTMKIATHETGHMFGILHCTAWQCNMCGCNSRSEADRHPLWCCPECDAKLCMATAADPRARYNVMSAFCSTNGFKAEAEFFLKEARALGE